MRYVILFASIAMFLLWDMIYGESRWIRYLYVSIVNLLRFLGLY